MTPYKSQQMLTEKRGQDQQGAQQVKTFAASLTICLIPWTHKTEGKNRLM